MAEHPILEAMARGISPEAFALLDAHPGIEEWQEFASDARGQALAALRKLAEAEPTPGMTTAAWGACDAAMPMGSDFPAFNARIYRAMLRALLEEVEAAHG